jgi:hypothetical protein
MARCVIPNVRSCYRTTATLSFDLHYAQLEVVRRWDRDRYLRLCAFLQLTPYELASLICWRHVEVNVAIKNSNFPGPVALLLTMIEAQAMINHSKDVIANPLPKHGS